MTRIFLQAVRERPAVASVVTIGTFFLTPLLGILNTPLSFDILFSQIVHNPASSILYASFSVLLGIFSTLYIYSKKNCISCKTESRTGFGGSLFGLILGICPACFSFIGFIVPLGGSLFLTKYSPFFLSISILLILFSIYKMGGFMKASDLNLKTDKGMN